MVKTWFKCLILLHQIQNLLRAFRFFIFQYLKYNNDTDVIKDRVITLANAVDAVSIQF